MGRGYSRKWCRAKYLELRGSNRRKLRNEELCGFNRHQTLRAVRRGEILRCGFPVVLVLQQEGAWCVNTYRQTDTTISASIITGGIQQLHVSALYVGHLQVVISKELGLLIRTVEHNHICI